MSLSNLVTVYCDRDWAQFCLQVESLGHIVQPITHWVIVNESPTDIDSYTTRITALYRGLTHTLRIVARPRTLSSVGWDNQQYYKLWIWTLIQDSYLVLDCKNFFVKDCVLDIFQGQHGPDNFADYSRDGNTFRPTLVYYSQQLGLEVQGRQLGCQTPFLCDSRVMQHLDLAPFESAFGRVTPSEFLYYSLWMQRMGMKIKLSGRTVSRTIWPYETLAQFNLESEIPYTVFALHRDWLARDPKNILRTNRWLACRGFESRL